MNPASKDVVKILGAVTSLALTPKTDLFYGRLPTDNPDCVGVFDIPGDAPLLTLQQSTSDYYYAGVSIQVRNTSYDAGYTVIDAIKDYLHGLKGETVGTTLYTLFKATNDPQLLHYDDKNRPIFVVNFQAQRRAV